MGAAQRDVLTGQESLVAWKGIPKTGDFQLLPGPYLVQISIKISGGLLHTPKRAVEIPHSAHVSLKKKKTTTDTIGKSHVFKIKGVN